MSTTTVDAPRPAADAPPAGRDDRPPFGRLLKVELRKMTDTRAGAWLLAGIAAVTVLTIVTVLFIFDAQDRNVREVMQAAIQPAAIVLPVAGVLLVTSEFSQRTALTTFALVPDRMRVLAAKAGAALVLAVITTLLVRLATTVAVAVSQQSLSDDVTNLSLAQVGQDLLLVATGLLTGLAFGALLRSSAPAIALYFVLPAAFAALGSIEFLRGVADWVDTSQALAPLSDGPLDATQWAQAGTSLALWLALPLAAGAWRLNQAEVA